MVDLHCHILPGVDDGSFDMDETMLLLKDAKNAGFDTICFTPHYSEPGYVKNKKQNENVLKKVKTKLKSQEVELNVCLGNEVFVSDRMSDLLDNGNITTLNDTSYILIEFPMFQEISPEIVKILINPLFERGIKVIVAHPERYSYIQKKPDAILEYFGENVFFQCNYMSIIGRYGKDAQSTIKKLLKKQVVSLLATDTHHINNCHYNYMEEIKKKLSRIVSKEYWEILTEINPRAIIENREIVKNIS